MNKKRGKILSAIVCQVLLVSVFAVAVPVNVNAATITVPDDYPTIQQAINAAIPGDTVFVRSGTYYEHVSIGKSLTLQGEDRNTTIIDAGGTGKAIYVTANSVTIKGITTTNGEHGISLTPNWNIHHIVISDCIVTLNTAFGIYAGHVGGYITIENCEVSKNEDYGIYSHQFHNSVIRNCQVFENEHLGIDIAWCNNSSIVNCDVYSNNGPGILLDSTWNCTVEGNNVWDNDGEGIRVFRWGYGYNNTVRNNVVSDNGVGISLGGGHNAYNNLIYHNDIISNGVQAHASSTNKWDNGYPDGGNYWSDYTGVDNYSGANQDELGSDGIGDTPYVFDSHQDNYPLVCPWNIVQAAIDIKPGSCPNPLNVKSKGVLPVAILGTECFDVGMIDVASIRLAGVDPNRSSYEDVAAPVADRQEECDCTTEGPDDYLDLTLKFKTEDIVQALGEVVNGEVLILTLTGVLSDGTSIEGADCIRVKKAKKPKGQKIAEHVYGIEIAQGWDYQFPGEDLIYECSFRVQSDASVDRVEFLTPAGYTFEITKLPEQWPNGKTSYEYDGETAHWEYWAHFSDESGLGDYGDGTYNITVFYEGGGQDQTTAWFGIPRTDNYMPQPTQKPISIFPLHNDTTTSRVTFEWEPCEDPSANLIILQLENLDNGEESLKWFQPWKNSWKNVKLSTGLWDVDLSFGHRYRSVRNNDNILVRVSKYSEIDYRFTIDE